jgi:hypothetical protein
MTDDIEAVSIRPLGRPRDHPSDDGTGPGRGE